MSSRARTIGIIYDKAYNNSFLLSLQFWKWRVALFVLLPYQNMKSSLIELQVGKATEDWFNVAKYYTLWSNKK